MKFDERDFDTLLESAVSEMPPEDIVTEVTPWKKSMHRVLIGLALSSLTLNFWYLNYLLPAVGMILMILGFRTMRRENSWFRRCYGITLLRGAYWFPVLILNASIYQTAFYEAEWLTWLTVLMLSLQLLQLVCLWQGIRAVQRKAELEEHATGAVWLMIWFGIICLLGIIKYSGIIIAALVILIYILAIRSLWKLTGEMDEAGYMMQAENVRVSDTVLTGIITGILILGIALAYTFGGTYSMDWQVTEVSQDAEISEIKKQLVSLGFPAEILDDLRHEDILDCRGASRVAVDVHEHPVNDGRFVQETRKNADGYLSFHRTTVYDVKELVITGIAVELQGEREQWKIIHHFRWAEDPGYFGTESIQLWPAYRNGRSGWGKAGECTGRILYDKDGITYSAPYVHLGEETYTQSSFFWENSLSTDIFAEFSLPHSGENQRGYIAYTIKQMQEGMIVDAWINYTHQQTWLQYPALTAKQQRMANSWNDAGAFITVQDALQFYPTEEEVKVFG